MNLQLDIIAIRNISKGKAKKKHTVDNVEQNSNVKVIQQHRHYICNSRETCYCNTNKSAMITGKKTVYIVHSFCFSFRNVSYSNYI
jgi:hypothetical protein